MSRKIDCIFVSICRRDIHLARLCLASIRYFYPLIPIRLLLADIFPRSVINELCSLGATSVVKLPKTNWGWGLIKLEPLFLPPGLSFLVLDADTIISGNILDFWYYACADFVVNIESEPQHEINRLYYDWRKVKAIDPDSSPPLFVFNSGQWFGRSGLVHRSDFSSWISWENGSPQHLRPDLFFPGDQGVFNYVLNKKAKLSLICVETKNIMLWPPKACEPLTPESMIYNIKNPVIVHWAGLKKPRLSTMPGYSLLKFFHALYYSQINASLVFKTWRSLASPVYQYFIIMLSNLRLKCNKLHSILFPR